MGLYIKDFNTWVYQYMDLFENAVIDYLRAAARGGARGKTVTSYLGGPGGRLLNA